MVERLHRLIIINILLIMSIAVAHAAVDVTFRFDQQQAQVYAYDCLDSACGQVRPFSGTIQSANPTTNGQVIVRFPDLPATPYNYALFFASPGYRPMESRASAHSNGDPTIHHTTVTVPFTKIPVCRAQVSDFSVINNIRPNIPVIVDVSASMDSNTASAFRKLNQNIAFIPPELKDTYYAADTRITLQIYKDGQLIDTHEQLFTAANGNPLAADTSKRIEFTYIPRTSGSYEAKVISEVIDPICAQTETQSSESQFSVLPDEPIGACYTILNNLDISNTRPLIGNTLTVTFNKISNFADNAGALTPVQTDVNIAVTDSTGQVLYSQQGFTYLANTDTVNPTTQSFQFQPQNIGEHIITITGTSNGIQCTTNHASTHTMRFFVEGQPTSSNLILHLSDPDQRPVQGATVKVQGHEPAQTGGDGTATIALMPGTYRYEIDHAQFLQKSGRFAMSESEKHLYLVLTPGHDSDDPTSINRNTRPRINLPSTFTIIAGTTKPLILDNYVDDVQDGTHKLTYNITGDLTDLTIDIDDGIAYITATAAATGTRDLTVRVTDTQGETSSDTITIDITSTDTPPVIAALPTITVTEDRQLINALYLPEYVNDTETSSDQLTYTIQVNETDAGITINSRNYIDINPARDFFGSVTATITVSDGPNQVTTPLTVNITGSPDAPIIQRIPRIDSTGPGQNITINLTDIVLDPDGTTLNFSTLNTNTDLGLILDETLNLLTVILGNNLNGNTTFTITVTNQNGESVTIENVLVDTTSQNDPPYFNQPIPTITLSEEGQASLDLSPFENDQEDGPGANNNALTWHVSNVNASQLNVSLDVAQDFLLITGVQDFFGTTSITLTLFDSTGLNTSQNVTVSVININDAPTIQTVTNQTIEAGSILTLTLNATDVDNEPLTFTSTNTSLPINASTGLVNITLTTLGTTPTLFTACDAANACASTSFQVTVVDTTPPSNLTTTQPAAPLIYNQSAELPFTVSFMDNDGIASVQYELNGNILTTPNVTQTNTTTYQINLTDLAAGNYTYRWLINDNGNNSATSQPLNFTIEKANSSITLLLNGNASNIVVADNTTLAIDGSITTPVNATISLSINGTLAATGNGTITTNATFAGEGTISPVTLTFLGDQNHTTSTITFNVTVNDTTAPNITNTTVTPPSGSEFGQNLYTFNATIIENAALHTVLFELDGVNETNVTLNGNIATFTTMQLSAGNHTLRWHANDTSGNSASSALETYTVTPAQSQIMLTLSPNTTVLFGTPTVANCTSTAPLNVTLTRNGILVANPDNSTLGAGTYVYACATPPSGNFTSNSTNETLTVTPIAPNITFTINGDDSSTPAGIINQTVTFSANATAPTDALLTLYINGTAVNTSNGTLLHTTSFPTLASVPIILEFAGNQNYTALNLSRTLSILPNTLIQKFNITPTPGTNVTSPFTLSFTTLVSTECRASTSDTDYTAMTISLGSGNTTNHTGSILIPALDTQNLSIACVGENSTNNLDLTYNVINVILSSTVSNSTITHSILNTSTVQNNSNILDSAVQNTLVTFSDLTNTSATNSNITNSDLTDCTIINSTVKNILATAPCHFENSIVDPPTGLANLTGSNISGDSTILTSDVTFSTVDNCDVTDSNIYNSTLANCTLTRVNATDSTITNSTIADATLTGATVTDGIITNGTINSTVFYNATASGPANITDISNSAPTASFTASSTSITRGDSITFTSTSTDANIGGALNDSITHIYTFSDDNSNTTTANATKQFSTAGSFLVTLTVTDAYGQSSNSTQTITVNAPASSGGGSSGGSSSGGGGGGGGTTRVIINPAPVQEVSLTTIPKEFTLQRGQSIAFTHDRIRHNITFTGATSAGAQFTIDTLRTTLENNQSQTFNISGDVFEELALTLLRFTPANATITARIHEQPQNTLDLDGTILEPDRTSQTVDVEAEQPPSLLDTLKEWYAQNNLVAHLVIALSIIIAGLVLYGLIMQLVR